MIDSKVEKTLKLCRQAGQTLKEYREKLVEKREKNLKLFREIKYGREKNNKI